MPTKTQYRWMRLIELLNSEEFGYPSSWFEDAYGNRSNLMANRTVAAQYIPLNAHRMRIDGSTWVHDDDWIYEDIQNIYDKLRKNPGYRVQIEGGKLYIDLSPEDQS